MGAGTFEVGLFKPEPEHGAAGHQMIPRTWARDSLMRSIPWMKLQNLQGRNIYVRPHGEHDLTMVDDLKRDSLNRMFTSGFKPALVVETSPGNFQAWLKHSKALCRETSTAAARALAEQFGGDKGAADWRHFGRLAGFTNRKAKYQGDDGLFPYVRLVAASGTVYPNADRFIDQLEKKLAQDRERAEQNRARYCRNEPQNMRRTIEHFRSNPVYGGDRTRIDLAYAIYALSHGASEEDVRGGIRTRDLSHKGNDKRQNEYVERTIDKALTAVQRNSTTLER
jgi:hypothetical protein